MLVVFGVVVAGILVFFWLRRRKARRASLDTGELADTGTRSTVSQPYDFTGSPAPRPNGRARLTIGAMTRWSCGHEQPLVRPLAPGLTPSSAPCSICGRPGVVGQLVAGRFVPVAP